VCYGTRRTARRPVRGCGSNVPSIAASQRFIGLEPGIDDIDLDAMDFTLDLAVEGDFLRLVERVTQRTQHRLSFATSTRSETIYGWVKSTRRQGVESIKATNGSPGLAVKTATETSRLKPTESGRTWNSVRLRYDAPHATVVAFRPGAVAHD
jgi:hypothetical protein